MRTINVSINTTNGFDTKYLFPGLVPNDPVAEELSGRPLSGGSMTYRVFRDGAYAPLTTPLSEFKIHIAGTVSDNGGDDVSVSSTPGWEIFDLTGAAMVQLAQVDILEGSSSSAVGLSSLTMLTPDSLASSLASASVAFGFTFTGNIGNDTLRGSDWGDTLQGGKGHDLLIGGGGSDTYYVDSKYDVISDTSGSQDSVYTTFNYTLPSAMENIAAVLGSGDIHLTGNSKANSLTGNTDDNVLKGMGGGDTLVGAMGKDSLYGGSGNDAFYFIGTLGSNNVDKIEDFQGGHDKIYLSQATVLYLGDAAHPATPLTAIDKDKFYASSSGKAHDASDRIIYDTDDHKLYLDLDGKGGSGNVLIATFAGHPSLHYTDIILI